MNYFVRSIVFILFAICSFYYAWSEGDRDISNEDYVKVSASIPTLYTRSIGYDHNAGNVVAVQTYMNVYDYSTPERFYEKLEFYLREAKRKGFLKEGTIVLFPEHIGTPLVLLGEKKDVYAANTVTSAFSQIGFANLFHFLRIYFGVVGESSGEIVFRMKSEEMKSVYDSTFRKLSALYKVFIVGGSILLPEPKINPDTGVIEINTGKFFNSCFIFLPDGKIFSQFSQKKNLTKIEKQVTTSSEIPDRAFLELKNVGILLSNDSIYWSMHNEKVRNKEILLSPSLLFEKDEIDWNTNDIYGKDTFDSNITQAELWRKYSIFEKTKNSPSNRVVIQVVMLGKFFDLTLEGESAGLIRYVATEGLDNKNPALLNVWF
ncbi:MAG: hypothetical protein IPL26_29730 [Leptospiraceae bacterium]|nr:hypothetical protein [Leptospiraceae bacterium]